MLKKIQEKIDQENAESTKKKRRVKMQQSANLIAHLRARVSILA